MSSTPPRAAPADDSRSPALRLARFGLALSQPLWPALATRGAVRLFCTPPPLRRRQRRAWPPAWQREHWPFERAGLTLYRQATAAPAVLLVHGWGGHAGQLLPLATALAARGLQPLLLEMPAHGRSAGSASNLPQFARALDYVAARLQSQGLALHAIVAHSLGANAAAYAVSRGLEVRRLVLLAPPASPQEYTRRFAGWFGLSERTRAALQQCIEAREGVLMPQFEPQAVGPRIGLPVLVVHDEEDRVNDYADGVAYSQAIAGARLHGTRGLGHLQLLKDAAVLARVGEFAAAGAVFRAA